MPDLSIFTSVINGYLPEPHASLLNGILFGISLKTTKEFYEQIRAVGLLHIVVLSGMDITLMAAAIGAVTASLGKKLSIMLTILIIIIFIAFVGVKAPIVRAGFMGILTLVAIVYGKRNISLFALFASGLFIGLFWPEWIRTLSFQLSYGATLGIILFGSTQRPVMNSSFERVKYELWTELKPSLAAQLFTVPLIFAYLKQISLIAPLSNLLVAPLLPAVMIFGFLTAFLGKMHYLLGLIPSYISFALLSVIVFVIETLSKVPFGYFDFSSY